MTIFDTIGNAAKQTATSVGDAVTSTPALHTDATNRRVYQMLQQGHSWMGLQTLYGLADSGISDQDLSTVAEQMRQATVQGTQAAMLKPGLILARKTISYQQGATDYARGTQLNVKDDLGQPKGTKPTTLDQQDAQTQSRKQYVAHLADSVHQADDGFKHLFDDPVLQKNPSAGLALARYLNGVLGPVPIKEEHLTHIQQQLQLQGFGRDLKADGVMSPAWNAATAGWRNSIYQSQLAGEHPGSISFGHAMNALQALTPVDAWDALIGYAKALPQGARQLMGDLAEGVVGGVGGLTVGTVQSLVTGQDWKTVQRQYTKAGFQASADVQNAVAPVLGGDNTTGKKEQVAYTSNIGARYLQDVSNIIMLAQGLSAVGKLGSAVGIEAAASTSQDVAEKLTTDAAFHGPGVIAKSLGGLEGVNPAIPRTLLGAGLGAGGTAVAGGTPAQIALGGVVGGAVGGLSDTEAFQHIPILGRTGPFIDALADQDGLYYKVRQFIHAPYSWVGGAGDAGPIQGAIGTAARLTDTAFNQSLLLGGEARGLAQVQDYAGGNGSTPFSKSVEGTHTVDALNDAISHRLGFTVLGQHIAPSINDLMFVFGGKGAEALKATNSARLEGDAQAVANSVTGALSDPGFATSIQRATAGRNKLGIKVTPTLHDLIQTAGGQDKFNEFWGPKIIEASASWGAERALATENADAGIGAMGELSDLSRAQRLQELEHEILHDPEKLNESIAGLRAQHGGEELTVRLKRDIAYGAMSPVGPQNDLSHFVDAQRTFRQDIHPTAGNAGSWANAPSDPYNFGFASTSRESVQQANRRINDFQSQWDDLTYRANADATTVPQDPYHADLLAQGKPTLTDYNTIESEMFDYLHKKLGVNPHDMPQRGTEMIDVMREQAKLLGADVYLHPDAPDLLKEQVADFAKRGYKPFAGTDIGYHIVNPSTLDATEGPIGFTTRIVEHAGLNPRTIPNAPLGVHQWADSVNALQGAADTGKIALPAGADATTIMRYLQDQGVVEGKRWTPVEVIGGFGVKKVAKDLDISTADAQEMVDNFPLQFRDWSRKKFVNALSGPNAGRQWAEANPGLAAQAGRLDPQGLEAAQLARGEQGADFHFPPMSRSHAERAYQILLDAAVPDGYYAGAAKIEDLFRAKMGFAGKALGQNNAGWAMANLPNALIQIRNNLRFDLSPAFSFRRWFKTNVKAAVEGIPPVWDPVEAMKNDNSFGLSRDVYERVRPGFTSELEYLDSGARYLKSQDIFGLYNGAMTEARAAGIWAKQGKTDEEIDHLLTRTFGYGNQTTAGRSALERSTNFVFFPFSFEKTLLRNLGGYLLDAPAQRLVMTRALAAYDDFNKNHMDGSNPLATSWYAKHAPILQEAAQLNAFSHGLSLGEPGGINRPLLNIFLPQAYDANQTSLDTLHRLVPAIKDFQRVIGEANDQKNIVAGEFSNVEDDLKQHFGDKGLIATAVPGGQFNSPGPRATTLTTQAQVDAGFAMQLQWMNDNKKYVDYNASTRDPNDKYKFPLAREWGRLAGQPITAANIRKIVSYKYPAFKAQSAVTVAVTNQSNWNDYVLDQKGKKFSDGQPKFKQLTAFATAVKDLAKASVNNTSTSDQLARRTDQIRQAAIFMAEEDPAFYKLYQSNFRKYLGPLETAAR